MSYFEHLPAGREYVMRVPGASNSALSDADLADVLNWLLTKDVQESLMKAVKLNSRRKGVTIYDPESAFDPAKLPESVGSQSEEITEYQDRASKLLREIMAK